MKRRMTIELSESLDKDLNQLLKSDSTYASSKVEIIRNALALYMYAMKEAKNDNHLAVVDNEGKPVRELVFT